MLRFPLSSRFIIIASLPSNADMTWSDVFASPANIHNTGFEPDDVNSPAGLQQPLSALNPEVTNVPAWEVTAKISAPLASTASIMSLRLPAPPWTNTSGRLEFGP